MMSSDSLCSSWEESSESDSTASWPLLFRTIAIGLDRILPLLPMDDEECCIKDDDNQDMPEEGDCSTTGAPCSAAASEGDDIVFDTTGKTL